ncbi:MAG: accessory gene regulator B family protein [Clostridia bacterium]|nr:accessory gene regulator B family protein [Clostridia bacterium]
MINKISEKLTYKLIDNCVINNDEYELYHYGLFLLLSEIWLLCYCLLVGAILKILLPSILFYVIFFCVHRFSGGFHAKSELHCQIITLSFFLTSIVVIKQSIKINPIILNAFYLCSSVILITLSPADTPQKPLSKKENIFFRKITLLIVILDFIAIVILNTKNMYLYANAITVAVFLQSLSVVCGRLFNKKLLTNNT